MQTHRHKYTYRDTHRAGKDFRWPGLRTSCTDNFQLRSACACIPVMSVIEIYRFVKCFLEFLIGESATESDTQTYTHAQTNKGRDATDASADRSKSAAASGSQHGGSQHGGSRHGDSGYGGSGYGGSQRTHASAPTSQKADPTLTPRTLLIRQELRSILMTHSPEKVQNIPSLLSKFRGKEEMLLSKVRDKYCLS